MNKVRKLVAKNQQQQDNFSSQEYLEYFKKLLSTNNSNDDIDQQYLDYIENSLPAIESSTTDIRGPLDVRISESEILTSIENLKRGKPPGTDLVLNEMLKTGKDVLTKPLCILFNNIIENGVYPKKWSCSIITPVFKGGKLL